MCLFPQEHVYRAVAQKRLIFYSPIAQQRLYSFVSRSLPSNGCLFNWLHAGHIWPAIGFCAACKGIHPFHRICLSLSSSIKMAANIVENFTNVLTEYFV
jgi:hypothetical protein